MVLENSLRLLEQRPLLTVNLAQLDFTVQTQLEIPNLSLVLPDLTVTKELEHLLPLAPLDTTALQELMTLSLALLVSSVLPLDSQILKETVPLDLTVFLEH